LLGKEHNLDFGFPSLEAAPSQVPMVLVVGNFDGVHRGHQRLLSAATEVAQANGGQVLVATFVPHPRMVLTPGSELRLLTSPEVRRRLLHSHGADLVLTMPFGERLRQLLPEEFLARLRARYRIVTVVAGPRVSIGRGGAGRLPFLTDYCGREGIDLVVVAAVEAAGEVVSSSAARVLLRSGDMGAVAAMLGRPFVVEGVVEHGDGRGRALGFPTANLRLDPVQALPPEGVYTMRVHIPKGSDCPAVGSIGTRPQYGGGDLKFEVHCLRPVGDLYGLTLEVEVGARLRGQEIFPSEAALVAQMREDAAAAATDPMPQAGAARVPLSGETNWADFREPPGRKG